MGGGGRGHPFSSQGLNLDWRAAEQFLAQDKQIVVVTHSLMFVFLMLALLRRTSFLTTVYGLYFSHHCTHITNYNPSHVGPLWAAFMYCIYTCLFISKTYSTDHVYFSVIKNLYQSKPTIIINKLVINYLHLLLGNHKP